MSTRDDLAAMRARVDAATEGPWEFGTGTNEPLDLSERIEWVADTLGYDSERRHLWLTWRPDDEVSGRTIVPALTGDGPNAHANAEFIAHARTDMVTLLDLVERQERALQAVLDLADGWTITDPRGTGDNDDVRDGCAQVIRTTIDGALRKED